MRNREFISEFVNGNLKIGAKNQNLSVSTGMDGAVILKSYQDVIAARYVDGFWLTDRKFSVTTSRHTNTIARECAARGIKVVRGENRPPLGWLSVVA